MKALTRISIIALCSLFFLNVNINAQTVSTEYTVAQIDEMHKQHRMFHPRNTVPSQELSNKFALDFPNARDIDWEKSDILYEVEFEIGRIVSTDYKAYYDLNGKLVMYKQEIPTRDLPAVVKNAALAKYPNFKFEDIDKIVKGKETFYQIELEKGDLEVKILVNANGAILNEIID